MNDKEKRAYEKGKFMGKQHSAMQFVCLVQKYKQRHKDATEIPIATLRTWVKELKPKYEKKQEVTCKPDPNKRT